MISFERSTRNERDVIREALEAYHKAEQVACDKAGRAADIAAHEWREYQAAAILEQLGRA